VWQSEAHERIAGLGFPIVYTTNYDANLETAFDILGVNYVKIAHTSDVARAPPSVTQLANFMATSTIPTRG
jgi:hypothetical protein